MTAARIATICVSNQEGGGEVGEKVFIYAVVRCRRPSHGLKGKEINSRQCGYTKANTIKDQDGVI